MYGEYTERMNDIFLSLVIANMDQTSLY